MLFKRKNRNENCGVVVQSAESNANIPFSVLKNYSPLCETELELYSTLREAVPVIDGAIGKLVRLTGDFEVKCDNKMAQRQLMSFLKNVNVNGTSKGIMSFLGSFLDQLLTFGEAVGEIVCNKQGEIFALYNASLKDVKLVRGDRPLEVLVCSKGIENKPFKYQELILKALLNPEPGRIKGNSILKGLPFVSSVLIKIFNTIGTNFERVGNIRFAVTYNPSDSGGIGNTKETAKQIAGEWSKAMRNPDKVCDFVSVGDISIKVIGAENQIPNSEVPVRQMLEQIVSKLSIPPFLLGLNWSSTERMSSQQTDILTSELEHYRTLLNPTIMKICNFWLRSQGYFDDVEIVWSNINLQDEVEYAQARLNNAKALQIEESLKSVENKEDNT